MDLTPDQIQFLTKHIDTLGLTDRAANILKSEGIYYVFQVVSKSETDILRIPNTGRKAVNKIKSILMAADLQFGMDLGLPEGMNDPRKVVEFLRSQEKGLRVQFAEALAQNIAAAMPQDLVDALSKQFLDALAGSKVLQINISGAVKQEIDARLRGLGLGGDQ